MCIAAPTRQAVLASLNSTSQPLQLLSCCVYAKLWSLYRSVYRSVVQDFCKIKRHVQVFENSIYLFFTHPFDIGDEIRFEGTRYTVKSMTLQMVKLISVLGNDIIVPTAEMRNSRLHNITRCPSLCRLSISEPSLGTALPGCCALRS